MKMVVDNLQDRVKEILVESDNANFRKLFINTKNIINEYLES